jgi:hypothetical protein
MGLPIEGMAKRKSSWRPSINIFVRFEGTPPQFTSFGGFLYGNPQPETKTHIGYATVYKYTLLFQDSQNNLQTQNIAPIIPTQPTQPTPQLKDESSLKCYPVYDDSNWFKNIFNFNF